MSDNPMQFIVDFIKYVDKIGIYDEYDKQKQIMVTSKGVQNLIDRATDLMPEKLKGGQAAVRMRELTDVERNDLIGASAKVVDMRAVFARRMAANGGARGVLEQLVTSVEEGDDAKTHELMQLAEKFVKEDFTDEK